MSSILELMQLDAAARAEADPYFSNIYISVVRPRAAEGFVQIQQRIDAALNCLVLKNSRGGVAVQFLMPVADANSPDAPGPLLDFTLTARIQEHPLLNMGPNGTGKSCEEVALYILQLLHQFNPGRGNVLVAATEAVTPSDQFAPKITLDARFTIKTGVKPIPKTARVTISAASFNAGQALTLSCVTAGASIYYTTDDSYPSSANAAAVLYSAPFTLDSSSTLRFAAEKAGLQQSDVAQQLIS